MVIYYNEGLVNFDQMRPGAGRPPRTTDMELGPVPGRRELRARAPRGLPRASRSRRPLAGWRPSSTRVAAPSSTTSDDPTSLAFGSDATQSALETMLTLFRDPQQTLTEEQLAEQSARESFERGQVAMIALTRALVPELRKVAGLRFDVMPIPSIEGQATAGEISGLCAVQTAENPAHCRCSPICSPTCGLEWSSAAMPPCGCRRQAIDVGGVLAEPRRGVSSRATPARK